MDNQKIDKNAQANAEKADKKAQKKNANKKPNIFVRMGGKIKAVVSELKKGHLAHVSDRFKTSRRGFGNRSRNARTHTRYRPRASATSQARSGRRKQSGGFDFKDR